MRLDILYTGGYQPPFSKKMVAAASFYFKIGGSGQYLVTLLVARLRNTPLLLSQVLALEI